jgi:Flp pilus assembly protein TadG
MKTSMSMFKRFAKNRDGYVSLYFGLAAVPLMIAMGAAVDYSRMTSAKAELQSAADAISLDAANAYAGGATDLTARAKEFLKLNPPAGINPADVVASAVVLSGNEKIKVSLRANVKLSFGDILGAGDSDDVAAETTTTIPVFSDFHKGEIVLVLDYSGSMDDSVGGVKKYVSMRTEVNKLINSLSQTGVNNDVKFGVVPFSAAVRTTLPKQYYYGQTGTSNSTRCLEDRKYPYNRTAATPVNFNQWEVSKFREAANANCGDYSTNKVTMRDLTTSHTGTINAINDMRPIGNTHITLGAEMGWHMLTPNAPYTQGVAMHTADTLKAMVIFTDGMQTSGGNGASNTNSVANAESNLEAICTAAKADGIRVFTVSFDLSDQAAPASETRLQNCSGPSSDDPARTAAEIAANPHPYYFNAETNTDLATAFGTIRNQLARGMYISK